MYSFIINTILARIIYRLSIILLVLPLNCFGLSYENTDEAPQQDSPLENLWDKSEIQPSDICIPSPTPTPPPSISDFGTIGIAKVTGKFMIPSEALKNWMYSTHYNGICTIENGQMTMSPNAIKNRYQSTNQTIATADTFYSAKYDENFQFELSATCSAEEKDRNAIKIFSFSFCFEYGTYDITVNPTLKAYKYGQPIKIAVPCGKTAQGFVLPILPLSDTSPNFANLPDPTPIPNTTPTPLATPSPETDNSCGSCPRPDPLYKVIDDQSNQSSGIQAESYESTNTASLSSTSFSTSSRQPSYNKDNLSKGKKCAPRKYKVRIVPDNNSKWFAIQAAELIRKSEPFAHFADSELTFEIDLTQTNLFIGVWSQLDQEDMPITKLWYDIYVNNQLRKADLVVTLFGTNEYTSSGFIRARSFASNRAILLAVPSVQPINQDKVYRDISLIFTHEAGHALPGFADEYNYINSNPISWKSKCSRGQRSPNLVSLTYRDWIKNFGGREYAWQILKQLGKDSSVDFAHFSLSDKEIVSKLGNEYYSITHEQRMIHNACSKNILNLQQLLINTMLQKGPFVVYEDRPTEFSLADLRDPKPYIKIPGLMCIDEARHSTPGRYVANRCPKNLLELKPSKDITFMENQSTGERPDFYMKRIYSVINRTTKGSY